VGFLRLPQDIEVLCGSNIFSFLPYLEEECLLRLQNQIEIQYDSSNFKERASGTCFCLKLIPNCSHMDRSSVLKWVCGAFNFDLHSHKYVVY
jgi:hypothetical protein